MFKQLGRGTGSLSEIQAQLAKRILDMTDNGEEVLKFYYGIMTDQNINVKFRLTAADWLANRMWGREPEIIHLNGGGIFEGLLQASEEQLFALVRGEIGTLPTLFEQPKEEPSDVMAEAGGDSDDTR